MARKYSYRLFSVRRPDEVDMRLFNPGLFQWPAAFEKHGIHGKMDPTITKESLEQSDIIHINFTPSNASYASAIREALGKESDTKLIGNVDFGTLMWDRIDPYVMRDQLNKCDFVFHVESFGAKRLTKWLGREVPVIPHPVDVEEVKKGFKKDRMPLITVQYHRYLNTWCEYFYPLREIKEEYDINIALMNFESEQGVRSKVPINSMFDEIVPKMDYRNYLHYLSNALLNIDITYDHTYGRGVVDAAALGVPTVGSNTIEAMTRLFPRCYIVPGNDNDTKIVVKHLLNIEKDRDEIMEHGITRCKWYSLEESYKRMTTTMEEMKVL
jgi:hypothetical protein